MRRIDRLLLGTRNAGKIAEIRDLFADLEGLHLLTISEFAFSEVDETGSTFLENALLKARTIGEETGLSVLAEDAGLEVDVLDGAPGVYSARFSGEPVDYGRNNRLLLERLQGITDRKARFVAVAALQMPEGEVFVTTGTLAGTIAEALTGSRGFGYDPLFVPEGEVRTLAEMTLPEKNRISHRTLAMRRMQAVLRDLLA